MGRGSRHGSGGVRRPKRQSVLDRARDFLRDLQIARSLGLTTDQFYDLPFDEQSRQIEAWTIENDTCPQCGGPPDKCSDPEVDWYPQLTVCYRKMANDVAARRWDKAHEAAPWHDGTFKVWSSEETPETPYKYDSGVNVWVADSDLGVGADIFR